MRRLLLTAAVLLLTGCASLTPDEQRYWAGAGMEATGTLFASSADESTGYSVYGSLLDQGRGYNDGDHWSAAVVSIAMKYLAYRAIKAAPISDYAEQRTLRWLGAGMGAAGIYYTIKWSENDPARGGISIPDPDGR